MRLSGKFIPELKQRKMTIKIHRILKSSLSKVGTLDAGAAGMSNTSGMTISHFPYSQKQTEATIPYEIEILSENVPSVSSIDFCVVVRTKVDLTATGVNGKTITNVGDDIGATEHPYSVPHRPSDLPPGFTEIYKG